MNIKNIVEQTIIERLSGISIPYNENETKVQIGCRIATLEFKDDLILLRIYRKNGGLMSYDEYRKDYQRNGEGRIYWPSGALKTIAKYKDDKRISAKTYDKYGFLKEEKYYQYGRLNGACKIYEKDGLHKVTHYSRGKIKAEVYYQKGKIYSRKVYGCYCGWGYSIKYTEYYDKNGKVSKRVTPEQEWKWQPWKPRYW